MSKVVVGKPSIHLSLVWANFALPFFTMSRSRTTFCIVRTAETQANRDWGDSCKENGISQFPGQRSRTDRAMCLAAKLSFGVHLKPNLIYSTAHSNVK